jgi:hypothetical protein
MLVDTGQVTDSGDDLADDGVYTATFTDTAMRGASSFHLRAIAVDPQPRGHSEGPPISVQIPNHIREATLSGTVNDRFGSEICNGNAFGEPGTTVQVPIVLDDGTDVAGFQVDVQYNPLQLSPAGVALGADTAAAGGWTIGSASVGPGTLRVLGASNPPVALGPGYREVALVSFAISPGLAAGASPLDLANCILSDERGLQIPCRLCGEPGQVIIRRASRFEFGTLPFPIGVDRFDPLPFTASAQAIDFLGGLATGYSGTAGINIPVPVCQGTLAPATMAFAGGIGNGLYKVPCCIDPLLPNSTFNNVLNLSDPANALVGTSNPFLGVAKGDLNASNMVDVLDVVRTTRLSLLLPVSTPPSVAFQRWAGDMLGADCAADGTNNVLDVVRVENKALGLPPLCPCPATGALRDGIGSVGPEAAVMGTSVGFHLEKARRKEHLLLVEGASNLGGFQVEMRGVGPRTQVALEGLTSAGGWVVASNLENGILRVIAYSSTATGIAGRGPVLRITGAGDPRLIRAIASDARGREVPVR